MMARTKGLLVSSSDVRPAKRAPSPCDPGNTSATVRSMWVPARDKATKRKCMRSKKICQRPNPFSKVGQWVFITPVARVKL